jgi:hypothetical protein
MGPALGWYPSGFITETFPLLPLDRESDAVYAFYVYLLWATDENIVRYEY